MFSLLPPRLRAGLVLVPLAAATAVAGCGSSSGIIGTATGSKTEAPNACSVLTLQAAKSLIGSQTKLSMKKQPNPHETHCQYKNEAKGAFVDIEVGDWNEIKGFGPEDDDKKLAGIGDQAWVGDFGLTAKQGSEGFTIDVNPESGSFSGGVTALDARKAKLEERIAPQLIAKL